LNQVVQNFNQHNVLEKIGEITSMKRMSIA
jgi:hypothetical protein